MTNTFATTALYEALKTSGVDLTALADSPWPTVRDEDWKYTNLALLARKNFLAAMPGTAVLSGEVRALLSPLDSNIVLCDGVYVPGYGTALPSGVSLAHGMMPSPEPALVTRNDAAIFLTLNKCASKPPLIIDIAPGVQVPKVIHLVYAYTESARERAVFPRVLLRVAAGSSARVFETHLTSVDAGIFINGVTDVSLAEGAVLDMVQASRHTPSVFHIASTRIRQAQNARLQLFQYTGGARIFRNNLSILLEGDGAEAVLNGLHHLKDMRHADSHTFIEHLSPHTASNQLCKSILDGESRSVFNGRILVHREAQMTNSYQLNKNMLLSRAARVDTKPQLEIFADDVKCSHGATIGQIDEDQLFYLQARGLSRADAMHMLVRGFVDDVVSRIDDPELRSKLEKFL